MQWGKRWLSFLVVVTGILLAFQIVMGILGKSLSLIADSAHGGADLVSYGLNLYVESRKTTTTSSDESDTAPRSLHADLVGCVASTLMLCGATGWACQEALSRLANGSSKENFKGVGPSLLAFSILSTLGNAGTLWVYRFWGPSGNNVRLLSEPILQSNLDGAASSQWSQPSPAVWLESTPPPLPRAMPLDSTPPPPPPPLPLPATGASATRPKRRPADMQCNGGSLELLDRSIAQEVLAEDKENRDPEAKPKLKSPDRGRQQDRESTPKGPEEVESFSTPERPSRKVAPPLPRPKINLRANFTASSPGSSSCAAGGSCSCSSPESGSSRGGWKTLASLLHRIVHPGCDGSHGAGQSPSASTTSTNENLNVTSALLHLVADIFRSITILVVALLIEIGVIRDAGKADALCALAVAGFVALGSLELFRQVVTILCRRRATREEDASPSRTLLRVEP
eukprot:TRINITY_DN33121_c0_g1_i2.p1 TRINITY_DN33121_c0_g1~~TRINITY_DN33121_c0_g1_i2.p1  ORF type:complete len:455 (-),score=64.21 TRINITY_DN33121_c0_g1_i2:105-1469(-)